MLVPETKGVTVSVFLRHLGIMHHFDAKFQVPEISAESAKMHRFAGWPRIEKSDTFVDFRDLKIRGANGDSLG
jgi:hypothetical protein